MQTTKSGVVKGSAVQPPNPLRNKSFILKALTIVVIVALAVTGAILFQHHNATKPKLTYGPPRQGDFCVDGRTLHTPVENYYGQGNVFATAFANIFAKNGGYFYTTQDGNIFGQVTSYKPINGSLAKTKHTITTGACKVTG